MITFVHPPEPEAPLGARVVETAIGPLRLVAADVGLVAVQFHPFGVWEASDVAVGEHPVLDAAAEQLRAYFAGTLTAFDLPVAPRGTEYQLRVWEALVQIPHGSTASYADVARTLGQVPGAARAVGLANGRNPIPVIVPCHRVIGTNGTLTGYAGGVDRKQVLLELERATEDTLF